MGSKMVKQKDGKAWGGLRPYSTLVLVGGAVFTFILSMLGAFPPSIVEAWYSRRAFHALSFASGLFANSVPFCWLDVLLIAAVVLLIICIRQRQWLILANGAAATYLLFFWGWGLNYHRTDLATKLSVPEGSADSALMQRFT